MTPVVKRAKRSDFDDLESLYNILGNQHRRNIILFLGEVGEASFTELRKHLGISVGTLYYNLDNLRGFVSQKPNKKYTLTPKGRKVYEIISKEIKRIEEMTREPHLVIRVFNRYFKKYITPVDLFSRLYKNISLSVLLGLIALAIGIYGTFITKLDLTLLEYSFSPKIVPSFIPSYLWFPLKLILSWIGLSILSLLLAKVFGSREIRPELIAVIAISLIPLFIYPYIYLLFEYLGLTNQPIFIITLNIIMRILQLITIGFLTTALSVFGRLSLERAFIIVFILMYISITICMFKLL